MPNEMWPADQYYEQFYDQFWLLGLAWQRIRNAFNTDFWGRLQLYLKYGLMFNCFQMFSRVFEQGCLRWLVGLSGCNTNNAFFYQFLHEGFLTPQEWGDEIFFKKIYMQAGKKSKKREGGVFHRQDWSQFKPFAKRNLFCKTNICEKHPLIAKKWVFILKKLFYKYFFFLAALKSVYYINIQWTSF